MGAIQSFWGKRESQASMIKEGKGNLSRREDNFTIDFCDNEMRDGCWKREPVIFGMEKKLCGDEFMIRIKLCACDNYFVCVQVLGYVHVSFFC
jgi:hypothetical protein